VFLHLKAQVYLRVRNLNVYSNCVHLSCLNFDSVVLANGELDVLLHESLDVGCVGVFDWKLFLVLVKSVELQLLFIRKFLFKFFTGVWSLEEVVEPMLRPFKQSYLQFLYRIMNSLVRLCERILVNFQNLDENNDNRILEVLPVVREEVVESPEDNDGEAKYLFVVKELHHEVGDASDGREHAFGADHDVAEVLQLELAWLVSTAFDEGEACVNYLAQ
jgi:hypothetical protein